MAGELLRPGVEVIQTFSTPSPSFARPALVPCVVGPAFEVVNVLTTEGGINSKAKFGAYSQLGKTITQSSFPDPRDNVDELDFLEETIRPFMLTGGNLSELLMEPGESFLTTAHGSAKAAIKSKAFGGGIALTGKVLVIALDQPVLADTSEDITITFTGTLTATQAAAEINSAVGATVATVVDTDKVQIASTKYGALSSVTVRAGGSANSLVELGYDTGTTSQRSERVEGAGWRGQDDADNDTLTPWIEFFQGEFYVNGTAAAFGTKAGLVDLVEGTFTAAKQAAVTFGTTGTIPLKVGDYFFVDGLRLSDGEVMKVEATRFKVGTINVALSTADENGRYTSKVYNTVEVATLFADDPFSPKYAYFKATGLDEDEVAPTPYSLLGSVVGAVAEAGIVVGTGATAPFLLTGLTLRYVVTINGVETEGTFTFTGTAADMPAVVTAIGSNIPGVVATDASDELQLATVLTGATQAIKIKSTGTANSIFGFSTSSDTSDTGKDVEISGLSGDILLFTVDDNPHVFSVTMISNSLVDACTEINELAGYTLASVTAARKLLLTSQLKGIASKVAVSDSGNAAATLGLHVAGSPVATAGTGRPFPDAYLDDANSLVIGAQILRDQVTGYPLDQATNQGDLYIQSKALRKDVSAVAQVAGVVRIPDTDTLSTVLDPLTEANPLGLATFLCMLNAPNLEVKCLGVDEVTAAAPEGTALAYARAAAMLEAEEVYALAPLTQDEVIHGMWMTHVSAMSEPEQAGERILFFNKKLPTRKNSDIAASGTQANSTATSNQMLLDVNPSSGLVGLGLNPADPFDADDGVYMEFEVDGDLRKYSISTITGSLVNFRISFATGENTDAFYSTVALTDTVVNAAWTLKVRGVSLTIPGSNPARPDYSLMAETVATANEGYKNRRVYSVFPETIKTTVSGIEKALPGYYACAAIAGMVAAQPPQQGFTNFPITGLTGVSGTEKFSKKQQNVMAGGGTYILLQEVVGGPVSSRHQLSTDVTSIETRELSITKVVDFVAKFLRVGVRKMIGVQNVDEGLLDTLGTTVQGMLAFLGEAGVLNGSNLNNLVQDTSQPDTVLIDVTLDVPYPCNYIRLTLVV